METTKPQTPQAPAKAVQQAGKKEKSVQVSAQVTNLGQSIRVTDKDLLLGLFPSLVPVFQTFPELYRLEVNHGNRTKTFSVWWKPHGQEKEGYDTRSLKSYLADKAKGIGRIY